MTDSRSGLGWVIVQGIGALVAAPFAASAQDGRSGLSYNYVQGGYVGTNTDAGDADGFGLGGSVAVHPNVHLFGSYANQKVDGTSADIGRLEDLLAALNTRMVDASKGENSLAQLTVRIQMAQADLATRDMMLQSALQQVEQTRMEANRQVRYLTVSVNPVPSQDPSYPRKFENTILAFLIFAGIYLMISLTASILREQVTS